MQAHGNSRCDDGATLSHPCRNMQKLAVKPLLRTIKKHDYYSQYRKHD